MKKDTLEMFETLFKRYPILEPNKDEIYKAAEIIINTYKNDGTLYVLGNGGSEADSDHITGELLKQFCKKREIKEEVKNNLLKYGKDGELLVSKLEGGLRAINLKTHQAFHTAFNNDKDPLLSDAQMLNALGRKGDTLINISTSGGAKNCYYTALVAKSLSMNVILLSGKTGGINKDVSDISIIVKETETYKIQELHLPIYHTLCLMVENEMF